MKRVGVVVVVIVVVVGSASAAPADGERSARAAPADAASPVPVRTAETTPAPHIAVAVNMPLLWATSGSFAASGYVGVGRRQVVRANFASYPFAVNAVGDLVGLAAGGDGDESIRDGRITDLGLAWMWFSRRAHDGLSLEAGVLRRARETRVDDDFAAAEIVETRTTTVGGRAMIGWSWLSSDRVFASVAVGVSVGHESGSETVTPTSYMPKPMTHDVSRTTVAAEGFFRLGVVVSP